MSAVVCGKRSNIFEESPSSPPVSKRIRWSSSPARSFSPPRAAAAAWISNSSSPLDHLVALFPDMERQEFYDMHTNVFQLVNNRNTRNGLNEPKENVNYDYNNGLNEQKENVNYDYNNGLNEPRENINYDYNIIQVLVS